MTAETLARAANAEVITSAIGAAAALGGFVLVFMGILINSLQSYGGDAPPRVIQRYQRAVRLALCAFLISLISAAVSMIWLLTRSPECLYNVAVILFFFQLGAVAALAFLATLQLVKR